MKSKITYIADIHDEKWSPKEKPIKEKDGTITIPKRHKIRDNNRNKLFCKCGGSIEFLLKDKIIPINIEQAEEEKKNGNGWRITKLSEHKDDVYGNFNVPNEFKTVTCPKCETSYSSLKEVEILSSSRTFDSNISSVRFRVFENEKTLSLCCYATRLIVNHRTKKLIHQDVKSSISLNKKWRFGTKISYSKYGKQIVRRFGLQHIIGNVSDVINPFSKIQLARLHRGTVNPEEIENEIISKMEEFSNRLLGFINPKDAEKLRCIFDGVFSYKTKLETQPFTIETVTQYKHEFIVAHKLPTILSTVIYPPLATVFFTKGMDFTLKILNSWIIPRVSVLKKEMPTAPIKILESFIRIKLLNDSMLRRRHDKKCDKANKANKNKETKIFQDFGEIVIQDISKPKSSINYDTRIPNDIVPEDKRLDYINITKKSYRGMLNPESIELFTILIFQKHISINDAYFFIDQYGIDVCYDIFSQISFDSFQDIATHTNNNSIRSREVEHLMKLAHKFSYENKSKPKQIVSFYVDTLRTLSLLKRSSQEILETKSFKDVEELHDRVYKEYLLVQNEILNSQVKESMQSYQYMNCDIGSISFRILDTVSGLKNESHEMHHCVGTYAHAVAERKFIVFKITDSANDLRATMSIRNELRGTDIRVFVFDQLKSLRNTKASDAIKEAAIDVLKNNNVEIKSHAFSRGGDLEIKTNPVFQITYA